MYIYIYTHIYIYVLYRDPLGAPERLRADALESQNFHPILLILDVVSVVLSCFYVSTALNPRLSAKTSDPNPTTEPPA